MWPFNKNPRYLKISDATRSEQIAFIRAALMTKWADGRVSILEQSEFDRVFKKIDWKLSFDQELSAAMSDAEEALMDGDKMRAYLKDIACRIESQELAQCDPNGYQ